MERNKLKMIAFVWGIMLFTLIIMMINNPITTTQSTQLSGVPQIGNAFDQFQQFIHTVQSNVTPPPGLR